MSVDSNDVEHFVTVSAKSLFEAVALGLALIKKSERIADIATGLNVVTVELPEASVKYRVVMRDFHTWLSRQARSPREVVERQRIREIMNGNK